MIAVLPALVQRPAWRSPSRSALMQQQDSGELAAQFAAERTRRQQPQQQPPKAADPGEEPFAGVREIVLDADGAPLGLAFGTLIAVASVALLLAIAGADAGAS
ncbi:hypothetical protein EMIHUDRAFT_231570 [Emiliania huxleyi CCMP1516]|uniref:Uncharacterized protein n=2 Tax=Emiliania huxleyi TaxID=2903 RepID=A0A0D3IRS5_EMIH1|nr:hypothetical protein EMIHUDRAFT_246554 [Emiliania huxleyi CCMP1516]XP_005784157.1 hypothetical protein EMIHUDRAFT_231570 [Emiliania huxleyi CCMP1516]EOD13960.1 hypothetical protein EMIHUDRAFT_246554 [Emiliania huxleyi CCMP1516]EOD31728.1 hypothetical protein EMIHUDRAFT_231570 [Emiliania huxleyi CCMP1516]|eukprot:XP_005766389.1 hypothetical protein EMIHUDRAFT_246554 [Emiliania huxleyi CCMP1516]